MTILYTFSGCSDWLASSKQFCVDFIPEETGYGHQRKPFQVFMDSGRPGSVAVEHTWQMG